MYGVHPSVCLSTHPSVYPICLFFHVFPIRPQQQHAAGLLLWARQAGDMDYSLHVAEAQCTVANVGLPRFQQLTTAWFVWLLGYQRVGMCIWSRSAGHR